MSVFEELDWRPPLEAFSPFAEEPYALLLYSTGDGRRARWSFIAARPAAIVEVRGRAAFLTEGGATRPLGPAAEAVAELLAARATPAAADGPPFQSGAAGAVSYEFGAVLEPSAVALSEATTLRFGLYDAALAFDHERKQMFSVGRPGAEAEAAALLDAAMSRVEQTAETPAARGATSNFSAESYASAVAAVQEKILAGDIFQANLAQMYAAPLADGASSYGMFRALAAASPAPFSAYGCYDDIDVLSVSPERFLKAATEAGGLRLMAEPIKGTRPRGATPPEDAALAEALVTSEKDKAENIMILDLLRNDLSRVAAPHTMREEAICELQTFSHVHHLVSRVSALAAPGNTAFDAFAAAFPCGSITGAPKIRAMQIIEEMEQTQRGIYCGAIGYFDDRGGADFNVAIRTAVLEKQSGSPTMRFGAGGGVTTLSNPEAEYKETLDKAAPFLKLMGGAK